MPVQRHLEALQGLHKLANWPHHSSIVCRSQLATCIGDQAGAAVHISAVTCNCTIALSSRSDISKQQSEFRTISELYKVMRVHTAPHMLTFS